ncbi:class I SAM-dependent methyltransferase [Candidatus Gracilibacteria bacterium]|nr:class I SAM-dependent methyltransferase [Candidatus Gracilibacteria bacterium]
MNNLFAALGFDEQVLRSIPVVLPQAVQDTLATIYVADQKAMQGQIDDSAHKFDYLRAWPIEAVSGELLFQIVRQLKPAKILELGTSFGASTIYMAAALQANQAGSIVTVEVSTLKHPLAAKNFQMAGVAELITTEHQAVDQYLKSCQDQFDLVLLDCDRSRYVVYLDQLRPHLRPGALLIADNAIDRGNDMKQYREKIMKSEEFTTVLLSVGDGLLVSKMR